MSLLFCVISTVDRAMLLCVLLANPVITSKSAYISLAKLKLTNEAEKLIIKTRMNGKVINYQLLSKMTDE